MALLRIVKSLPNSKKSPTRSLFFLTSFRSGFLACSRPLRYGRLRWGDGHLQRVFFSEFGRQSTKT